MGSGRRIWLRRGRRRSSSEQMYRPLVRCDQRAKGEQYVRGLLLEGRRKSIQPMAVRLPDGDEEGLQQFIADSPWDDVPVRRRLARRMTAEMKPQYRLLGSVVSHVVGELGITAPRTKSDSHGRYTDTVTIEEIQRLSQIALEAPRLDTDERLKLVTAITSSAGIDPGHIAPVT